MDQLTAAERMKFRAALEPLVAMLDHKKDTLNQAEWRQQVMKTRARVLAVPYQYLDANLSEHPHMSAGVAMVFDDLLGIE